MKKTEQKLDNLKKEDFDRYTKGPESPAKSAKRFHGKDNKDKYDPESLMPGSYDEQILHEEDLRRST